METLGWLLLFALTSLAGSAAIALAKLVQPEGRAEAAVTTLLFFWGLIVLPIFALGYSNALHRTSLALLSGAVSSGVLLVSARRGPRERLGTAVVRACLDFSRLAWDGVKECWRAKSFALLGVLAAAAVIAFTLCLCYVVPADESWDGLYYHQPIVGFALQNHGFGWVELPNTLMAQTINGYPKFGEAFSLWFVVFTDKTLLEIGGSLAAPGLMLSSYLLARRYSADRVAGMGWAAVLLLMPALYSQLRSTMVDVELWFFALSAVYFITKPQLRPRDAALGLLATAWVVATKSTGLVLAPPLLLVACVRSLRQPQWCAHAPWLALGVALIALLAALTFLRNYQAFHNPLWPVSYTNRALGIDWRGLATVQQVSPDPSLPELVAREYDHPGGGVHDIIVRSYGNAVPWLIFPLGALGLVTCLVVVCNGVVRRARDPVAENLLLVAVVTLLPFVASPSFSNARYNVQAVVAAMLAITWSSSRLAAPRLQEGALAGSILLSLMSLVWSGYLWGLGLHFQDIGALLAHTRAERASMNFSKFQMPASVAQLREAELGAGDVAAFTSDLTFIGVLWNERFSNRVVYLPSAGSGSLLERLSRLGARWVAVGPRSAARRQLEKSGNYEYVGSAAQQDGSLVFRRRSALSAPSANAH